MMSKKKEFLFKDRLIKGIEPEGRFKISVVKTTDVVETARQNHGLHALGTVMLGRALTAAMLLASELKGEERIKLRFEGNGPLGAVTAEANRVGEVRGYVKNPLAVLPGLNGLDDARTHAEDTRLGDGLGIGLLMVSKVLYNEAEPKTSTIELTHGDINGDVAHFMAQSEQVLSAVLLDVSLREDGSVGQAGGVLIQRLPGADEKEMERLHTSLSELEPVASMLDNGYYIDDIMKMASRPFDVKELDRQPVHFFCRCSPKRFKSAMSMLHVDDLKEMEGESQEIVCHYCSRKMTVSKEEIQDLIEKAQAKMN